MIVLTRDPISVDTLLDAVRDRSAGAIVVFLGVVRAHARGRNVRHLEYEAYDVLARKELARIETDTAARWGVRVAIVHRLGHLEIGEVSVAIAVSSAHRQDAFEAGRHVIDTLKQTVPIWKKEVWADGAEWIGQDDSAPAPPTDLR
jgi:molybdopterin synthase catalytic subunit